MELSVQVQQELLSYGYEEEVVEHLTYSAAMALLEFERLKRKVIKSIL